jgi:DNA modification methylase
MTTPDLAATASGVVHERYELMRGDCCELLAKVASGSVHCILADPPYGIAYESKAMAMLANDQQPYVWWLSHASRVLAEEGVLVCFCRWDVGEAFRQAIAWSGLQMAGQLVWDRMLHGQGDTSRTPAPQHDIAWVATKGKWTFPATRGRSVVRAMRERGGFGECAGGLLHPTMKPIALMEELVLTYSAPGQTVLDPTMGSGSTGVAAVKHGRKFVGIELDNTYFAVAKGRIARAAEERSMFCGHQHGPSGAPKKDEPQQFSLLEDFSAGHLPRDAKGTQKGAEDD